jgi:hypothetical protein
MRGEALRLKLEITGERSPVVYPYTAQYQTSEMSDTARGSGERFGGDSVSYHINGREYKNIYGVTLISKKAGGTKTELWVKRAVMRSITSENGNDLPELIKEITLTAQLLRDTYEHRKFGTFRITVKKPVLTSDETEINAPDTVIGPLRYYVAGTVSTEVFSSRERAIQCYSFKLLRKTVLYYAVIIPYLRRGIVNELSIRKKM